MRLLPALTLMVAASLALPSALALAAEDAEIVTGSANAARSVVAQLMPSGASAPVDKGMVDAALAAYRRNEILIADALAATSADAGVRAALEWAALRSMGRKAGSVRIRRFLADYPGFPGTEWLRRRVEEALLTENASLDATALYLGAREPETAAGKVLAARILRARGELSQAHALLRSAWREDTLRKDVMDAILAEFPDAISPADNKYRAERLIYDSQHGEGMRFATIAGPDTLLLAKALSASVEEAGNAGSALAAVPKRLAGETAYQFAAIQQSRRKGQIDAAAQLMLRAPRDAETLVDGDEWWVERRLLARKLLDQGNGALAYKIASEHTARSTRSRTEAEFHAGWIALRFLKDANVAKRHFEAMLVDARAPQAKAKAHYWLARAMEAGAPGDASKEDWQAQRHLSTFYGQLSRARLGYPDLPVRHVEKREEEASDFSTSTAARAVDLLLAAKANDFALPLILDMAQTLPVEALDGLGDMLVAHDQPRLLVLLGKTASQRGFFLDKHAFPTLGIPPFEALEGSAERAIVYAIARQESEFDPKAVSGAGARGLMQLLPSTARAVARTYKLPFDAATLTTDASMNARLGAAHLGELLARQRGSLILTFAGYNAGPGRVREWMTAYGDPREPEVDPVDWIERIPFTETRHYVQRILENLQVYRARLYGGSALLIHQDLLRGRRPFSPAELVQHDERW